MLRDGLTGDWIGTFVGHKGAVWSARVSADGSLAATGSADFSAKVWDTFTGEQLHTLQHNHIVRAVAFPALQDRPVNLATGGMEKKLRIWDLTRAGATSGASSGDECYEVGAGEHGQTIKSIVWSAANPNVLTTACDDKKLRWWDLRSRSAVATHEVEGTIGSCELNSSILDGSANGTLSVAAGKTVYFFDGARPGALLDSKTLDQEIASVAVCGSQRRFVTGSPRDTFVRVWDLDSGAEIGKWLSDQLQQRDLLTIRQKHARVTTVPYGRAHSPRTASSTLPAAKTAPSSCGRLQTSLTVCGDKHSLADT